MKTLALTLTLMTVLMTVAACGPEISSADKDRAQVNEEVTQARAQYTPFQGVYMGTLKQTTDGTTKVAQLNVQAIDSIVSNPSRNEPSAVPTLEGGLQICMTSKTCFNTMKSPSAEEDALRDTLNLGTFNIAKYDAAGQTLVLQFGSPTATTTSGGTGSSIPGALLMNLHISGNRLYGVVSTYMGPEVGQLDVTRK